MSKRSKKLPKKRQNSDYWIHGHHAVVGALMNENRVKYEVYFTSEAEKKLKNEIKLENLSNSVNNLINDNYIQNLFNNELFLLFLKKKLNTDLNLEIVFAILVVRAFHKHAHRGALELIYLKYEIYCYKHPSKVEWRET